MKFISKSQQLLSTWSGGTTRQIWIFPEDGSYANRNFKIRLSTATVETEKSTFTPLPGYFRTLMVLEGELKVEHKGQHTAMLKKFDTDHFMGDWETTGYGKCTDFNAMCTQEYDIKLHSILLEPLNELPDLGTRYQEIGFYIHQGEAEVFSSTEKYHLHEGDFVLLENHEPFTLYNTTPAEVIVVSIRKLS